MILSDFQYSEFDRCSKSFEHFFNNYVRVISNGDKISPTLNQIQQKILSLWHKDPNTISIVKRQEGTSTLLVAYALWLTIFSANRTYALVTQSVEQSWDSMNTMQNIYDELPFFIKPNLQRHSKNNMTFDNQSSVVVHSLKGEHFRGRTISGVLIDGAAQVESNALSEFMMAMIPALSSGAFMHIVTTPSYTSHYLYKVWKESIARGMFACKVQSDYSSEMTDEERVIKTLEVGKEKFKIMYECGFMDDE